MSWGNLAQYAEWALEGWLALIVGIVLVQMATGRIILTGLVSVTKEAPYGLDRLQLVFVTLLFAVGYALFALNPDQLVSLPNIPTPLLLVLIGSNGAYLAVKYSATMGGRGRQS
jgi:hypothetical protein